MNMRELLKERTFFHLSVSILILLAQLPSLDLPAGKAASLAEGTLLHYLLLFIEINSRIHKSRNDVMQDSLVT